MLKLLESKLPQVAKVVRDIKRGPIWQSWRTLQDEFWIALERSSHGRPFYKSLCQSALSLPNEPLPPNHAYVVISDDNVAMGPLPEHDNIALRFRRYLHYLKYAFAAGQAEYGEYVLSLIDEHPAEPISQRPNLTFNRRVASGDRFIVVPDARFARSAGHAARRLEIDRHLRPWKDRLPQAIWRGSSTGAQGVPGGPEVKNLRIELCRVGARLPDLADFRVTRLSSGFESQADTLRSAGVLGPFASVAQQIQHRILVSIDGNAGEWEGMFWKLYSGCVVLMVESDWEQWYSSLLQPWEHFVPVAANLSDLEKRLHWCRDHDDECQAIGTRARQLMQTEVTFRNSVHYVRKTLSAATQAANKS